MTYVITRSCCSDASCVPVCPVNCIHPTPDEPGYLTAEMLYIDPDVCIECGACMDACPVAAIAPDYDLTEVTERYEEINAGFYRVPGNAEYEPVPTPPVSRTIEDLPSRTVRIAIVGSGPAACYAAQELLETRGGDLRVDMLERLAVPFGLVRYGVAPDHGETKVVAEQFTGLFRRKGFRLLLNVEVGVDVTHEQLLERYDAVIYAVGASQDRRLGIPGEDLAGSLAASDLVGWYNGHPDHAALDVDLATRRAVVVGNGNVALDIARLLASPPDVVARTDAADHALAALADSQVEEVVVLGRRGPAEAAFTTPELLGLLSSRGVAVRVEGADPAALRSEDYSVSLKLGALEEAAESEGERTVVLRFLGAPVEILGEQRVAGVRIARQERVEAGGRTSYVPTTETDDLECGLVVRSIGFRGTPVPGLPFDEARAVVPHERGRVAAGPEHSRTYVTGWIKRGPSGVIGTNRVCARETVDTLLADLREGVLVTPGLGDPGDVAELVPDHLGAPAWKAIDRHERAAGRPQGRPRVKLVGRGELLRVGRGDD